MNFLKRLFKKEEEPKHPTLSPFWLPLEVYKDVDGLPKVEMIVGRDWGGVSYRFRRIDWEKPASCDKLSGIIG